MVFYEMWKPRPGDILPRRAFVFNSSQTNLPRISRRFEAIKSDIVKKIAREEPRDKMCTVLGGLAVVWALRVVNAAGDADQNQKKPRCGSIILPRNQISRPRNQISIRF